ncbi:hypothetical protein JCM11251_002060 [Rhodosporidiobolus azoricus]
MADIAPHLRPSLASPSRSRSWLGTPSTSSTSLSAPGMSTSPPTSAYTASLPPTYRRSSFPAAPPSSCLDTSPTPSTVSALLLPPGLALQQRGCTDDEGGFCGRGRGWNYTATDPTQTGVNGATSANRDGASSSSAPSSRKSSSSSCDSFANSSAGSGAATPLSSVSGSVLGLSSPSRSSSLSSSSSSASSSCERTPTPRASTSLLSALDWSVPPPLHSPAAPTPRSLSYSAGSDEIAKKRKQDKEKAAGTKEERESVAKKGGWEDPALARARRALWEDVAPSSEGEKAGEGEVFVEEEEDGEDEQDAEEEEQEGEDEDDWHLPPARPPTSASTHPLHSCLRSSSLSRSFASLSCSSASSTTPPNHTDDTSSTGSSCRSSSPNPCPSSPASSSLSLSSSSQSQKGVSFSPTPPTSCLTYSPLAYPRSGLPPVEKLSIREWMELQGVREAVGVWSGRVGSWGDVQAAIQAEAEEKERKDGTGAGGGAGGGEAKGELARVACSRLRGVVQVARSMPSSPIEGLRGLPDV